MILFNSSILKLDYDPGSDILQVNYPDLYDFLLPEIKHYIDKLVDAVKHYDVKLVLLDSTKTVLSVQGPEAREIAMYLAAGFLKTRVEKVARVQSPSSFVETTAQENMRHITQTHTLPFELQNFVRKEDAILWLKGKR